MKKWLCRMGMAAAAGLAAAPRVLAQGCAMCYADAAAQSPRARHHLDLAILTLLVPSVLMFAGVLVAAFRRRERDLGDGEQQEWSDMRLPRTVSTRPRTLSAPDALL
jgi:hypothetical protein